MPQSAESTPLIDSKNNTIKRKSKCNSKTCLRKDVRQSGMGEWDSQPPYL